MNSWLSPTSPAWYLCRAGGWLFLWPGTPQCTVSPRRPTPLRLARATVTRGEPTPPRSPAPHWLDPHHPGRVPMSQLPALWRHWRWWRANLDRHHLRRGDLAALVDDPTPANWAATTPYRLNLTQQSHYAWLINTSLATDLWVRRSPSPRRRHITLALSPPGPPGMRRALRWAHHDRGDLTWAPRPPRTQQRGRWALALASVLLALSLLPMIPILFITLFPAALLLLIVALAQIGSPTSHPTTNPQQPDPLIEAGRQYATWWHTTGYKHHRL